jgi:hypothetical protein
MQWMKQRGISFGYANIPRKLHGVALLLRKTCYTKTSNHEMAIIGVGASPMRAAILLRCQLKLLSFAPRDEYSCAQHYLKTGSTVLASPDIAAHKCGGKPG